MKTKQKQYQILKIDKKKLNNKRMLKTFNFNYKRLNNKKKIKQLKSNNRN